jgi:uncharacterized protein (TIGR02145 family)
VKHISNEQINIVLIVASIAFFFSCKKEEPLSLLTEPATFITYHSADCGFKWSGNGSNFAEGGICYSDAPNPSYNDKKISVNTPTIASVSKIGIDNLEPDKKYFIRSFLIKFTGTAVDMIYGNEVEFTTLSFDETITFNPVLTYDTISDIDGNIYKTIQIGNQIWMAENLGTTRLNDGTSMPQIIFNVMEENYANPAYGWNGYYYESYKSTFGNLYNWYAVNTGKLCPAGWHVPSDDEWETLISYLGGINVAGDQLKETGTTHWDPPNAGSTNESGFTALPALVPGSYSGWWSTTRINPEVFIKIWCYSIMNNYSMVMRFDATAGTGLNVRCIKDN